MTPDQIIERKIREILDRPQQHAGSVVALEATLFALLDVFVQVRGEDTDQVIRILRQVSASTFGSSSAASPAFRVQDPHKTIGDQPEIIQLYRQWVEQILLMCQPKYAQVLTELEQLPVSLGRHQAKSFVLAVQTAVQKHPPIRLPKITIVPLDGNRIEVTVENFMRILTVLFDSLGDIKIRPEGHSLEGTISWTATPPLSTWVQWVSEPLSPLEYYKVLVRGLLRERKKREIDPKEEAQIAQKHEEIWALIPESYLSHLEMWIEEQKAR